MSILLIIPSSLASPDPWIYGSCKPADVAGLWMCYDLEAGPVITNVRPDQESLKQYDLALRALALRVRQLEIQRRITAIKK